MRLVAAPISFRDAAAFVKVHHRHHTPPAGHKFSIAALAGGELVGVVIVGRAGCTSAGRRLHAGSHPALHERAPERLFVPLWRGVARRVRFGLLPDRNIRPEVGAGDVADRGWLETDRRNARQVVVRAVAAKVRQASYRTEVVVRKGGGMSWETQSWAASKAPDRGPYKKRGDENSN